MSEGTRITFECEELDDALGIIECISDAIANKRLTMDGRVSLAVEAFTALEIDGVQTIPEEYDDDENNPTDDSG